MNLKWNWCANGGEYYLEIKLFKHTNQVNILCKTIIFRKLNLQKERDRESKFGTNI